MKRDPSRHSFTHLGKDGVLRVVTPDNEVLDARPLNPTEITALLDSIPAFMPDAGDFQGVDGTKVTSREQLFFPAPGILPKKPETEQEIEEAKKKKEHIEKLRDAYLKIQ